MALGANISRVMGVDIDLVEPFRTRRAGLMAPHTHAYVELGQFFGGIHDVRPAGSMARFARKRFVFAFGQFLSVVGMAFQA